MAKEKIVKEKKKDTSELKELTKSVIIAHERIIDNDVRLHARIDRIVDAIDKSKSLKGL